MIENKTAHKPASPSVSSGIKLELLPFTIQQLKPKRSDSYHSTLDRFDFIAAEWSQLYSGTLGKVLEDLEIATASTDQQPFLPQLALHPARVIRAAIEYKIANPNSPQALSLLKESIALGINIYRDPNGTHRDVEQFRQHVIESAGEQLLSAELVQPPDSVTWLATDPDRSKKTAARLVLQTQKPDLLFIALAHGGVTAGLDVFLRYAGLVDSDNSEFYVARFSRYKSNDQYPQLSPEEIRYLKDKAFRRQVVIFDEDTSTGSTLRKAQAYFENVFAGQIVKAVTNHAAKSELTSKKTGVEHQSIEKFSEGLIINALLNIKARTAVLVTDNL